MLGDRIRLSVLDDKSESDSIYVRSIATRSSSGSIPSIVRSLAHHLLANDFDFVFIETVGAGQSNALCCRCEQDCCGGRTSKRRWYPSGKSRVIGTRRFDCGKQVRLRRCDKVVNDLTVSLGLTNDMPPIIKTSTVTSDGLDELIIQVTTLEKIHQASRKQTATLDGA